MAGVAPSGNRWEKRPVKGQKGLKTFWLANGALLPIIMGRNVEEATGSRHSRRPGKIARASGLQRASDIIHVAPLDGTGSGWASEDGAPDECHEEDLGWQPGPIHPIREFAFLGRTPGLVDASL